MFKNLSIIKLTRGDTGAYSFTRKDKDGETITEEADKVFFTVKRNYYIDEFELQKTIDDMTFDNGKYSFTIEPEDTENLNYGKYVYDIEVIMGNYKKTISIGDFILTNEVTFEINEV